MAEPSSVMRAVGVRTGSRESLWAGLVAGASVGAVAMGSPATLVVVGLVGVTLWGIWRVQPCDEREWLMWAFGIAWGIRVALSAGLHLWHGWVVPYGPLALEADSGGYLGAAWFLSETWHGRYESLEQAMMVHWRLFHGIHPFIYVMGAVFYLFGFSPVAVTFLNAWIALMGLLVLYGVARRVTDPRTARVAFVLAAAAPSGLLVSITHLKEPLLFLGLSVWMWAGLRWLDMFRPRYLIVLMLAGWIVWWCREWMLPICVIIALAFTLGVWLARRRPPVRRRISVAMAVILGAGLLLMHRQVTANIHAALLMIVGKATSFRYAGGSSYYLHDPRFSEEANMRPAPLSRALFRGWRQVVFSYWPPLKATSSRQRLALPEVLLVDAALPLAAIGWCLLLWRRRSLTGWWLASMVGGILTVHALSEGNVGTLFRHKQFLLPIYALVVAVGWTWVRSRWRAARDATA